MIGLRVRHPRSKQIALCRTLIKASLSNYYEAAAIKLYFYTHAPLYRAQVIPYRGYSVWVLAQLAIFHLTLNHAWIALLTLVTMAQPRYAHRISPILSAVAGFAGGFFVPPHAMPVW